MIELSKKERATIVAALRYWQETVLKDPDLIDGFHFTEVEPLTTKEVDALCKRLEQ